MKYIIYARKSTDTEEKQVLSIEAQIAELKEFAAKEKLEIVASFQEAKTAKAPGRTVFGRMVEGIEHGEADGIIAWHPDRLARNPIDGGKIIYLTDTGKLHALKFPTFWFENTPQGKFMLNIAFGQSKYYIDNLSENVKRGIRQKLRRGEFPGWAPLGYSNDPRSRSIVLDEAVAPLVREIFTLYSTGNWNVYALADWCKQKGLRGHRGRSVAPSRIHRLLGNPFYCGLFRYNN